MIFLKIFDSELLSYSTKNIKENEIRFYTINRVINKAFK